MIRDCLYGKSREGRHQLRSLVGVERVCQLRIVEPSERFAAVPAVLDLDPGLLLAGTEDNENPIDEDIIIIDGVTLPEIEEAFAEESP